MPSGPDERNAADGPGDVTRLLQDMAAGRSGAADELFPLIYAQLRAAAQNRMAQERPGHTLQATALVHEAYICVVGEKKIAYNGRAHFFHVAAEAMRRLLIDHARARGRVKRGGGRQRRELDLLDLADHRSEEEILELDSAIQRLEEIDPEAAEVVRMRFFAGLDVEQTAEALGVSPRTVKRDWAFARAWLYRTLEGAQDQE